MPHVKFSHSIRHIPALAFLPASEIPAAFDILKDKMPNEAKVVVQWFEDNYVHGRIKRVLRNGIVSRLPPLYPPDLWSVSDRIGKILSFNVSSKF